MSINRDEALRAKDLAEGLMRKTDFTGARKLALKAQKMDSTLENISRMLMVCDVHCAAENMFGNDKDWYGILQVDLADTDVTIKKQYRKLALLLHPDKNKFPGAESAFKLIGEAQRILLDCEKRTLHDIKRRTSRKPAAPTLAPKPRSVPNYQTQHVYAANGNVRNMFNELRPENRYPQQQAQPAGFSLPGTFFTTCLFCNTPFEYMRIHMNKIVTCQICSKRFTALETPMAKSTCQTNFSFPQQNMFPPGQKATNEPQKRPESPVSRKAKASVPMPPAYTAENNNAKKKRKAVVESSESSVSSSETEEDDVATNDTKSTMSSAERRRSVRSKRQVSYNENVSDDDVGLGNDNGEASGKDMDTEREEEPEDEKKTNEDHRSTESKDSKKKKKKKMMEEDQVVSSDSEEDLSAADAEPNMINYDDPDFNDFDKLREKSCFEAGQIWALYDEDEGMPRFYALIRKVITPNFSVKYVWLEADDGQDYDTRDLPVSVGKYELGGEEKANDTSVFSHLVVSKTKNRARKFKIFPKKGETWALFKNWNTDFPELLDGYEYEFAEILSDNADGDTVTVGWLSKVKNFSCVFQPMRTDDGSAATSEIPPQEFCRFSHSIPFFKLTGTEGRGVSEGWYELDPAALPETIISKKNQDNQSPL